MRRPLPRDFDFDENGRIFEAPKQPLPIALPFLGIVLLGVIGLLIWANYF
jgi:hypothetical protein